MLVLGAAGHRLPANVADEPPSVPLRPAALEVEPDRLLPPVHPPYLAVLLGVRYVHPVVVALVLLHVVHPFLDLKVKMINLLNLS